MAEPPRYHEPPDCVDVGTCPGCGSLTVNPMCGQGCCEDTPGLIVVPYDARPFQPSDLKSRVEALEAQRDEALKALDALHPAQQWRVTDVRRILSSHVEDGGEGDP